MFSNLANLIRYRTLIQSLVARELKARYRGSILGFFWSFVNPLLQLLTYGLVFTVILPVKHQPEMEPYLLFFFCGILPWTWFASSLTEAAGSLISGGNLIKKVLFPAEVLPIVSVLANMVHFFLGLLILVGFLVYYRRPPDAADLIWFPLAVVIQLVFTTALATLPNPGSHRSAGTGIPPVRSRTQVRVLHCARMDTCVKTKATPPCVPSAASS